MASALVPALAIVEPGTVLVGPAGRYRIVAEQGRGAAGVTYRAVCDAEGSGTEAPPSDGRAAAAPGRAAVIVKVLAVAGQPGWKALELFEREASVLAGLSHRGIPAFLDHFPLGGDDQAPTGFALVMALVEGQDLRRLGRGGGLSQQGLLDVMDDVLEVLAYIHDRAPPLVHRDVNPKNIVVGPDGRASLVDFGSVQAALRAGGGGGELTSAGTFGYAPLEQFMGRASPASDLYGLGMTYLALASGREPEQMPLAGIRVDVRQLLAGDPRLLRLIARMTEPDPRARTDSAAEARALLRTIRGGPAPARAPADSDTDTDAGARPASRAGRAGRGGAGDYLAQLAARLAARGFTISEGGNLGATALAFVAEEDGSLLGGEGLRILATRDQDLEGGGAGALGPVAAALFAQAAGDETAQALERGATGFLDRLRSRGAIVVPLIAYAAGPGRRTAGHLAASLRERGEITLVPVLVDLRDERAEVITPRSMLGGDPRGRLDRVRRALAAR